MSNANPTAATPADGAPPSAPDLTGRTLGDFRVLRKIGQGGMGQVYLAEQISLKRKVALKILRPDLASSPGVLQRFQAEAENVARATHANIVQVYAIDQADGTPYMALEYVEGRNLREYLTKKGPPELLLALSIMRQVASALQRAGELGLIHRDVKPENILLTRKGEVKVADFGLSRCVAGDQPPPNLTQSGVTMGTPLYMSPEQVEGKPLDPRTDIYSFGVTCYHMLAGQPPFQGESAFEVALAHVRRDPLPLASLRPDLPEGLCAVVHKMMAKDPAARYQTARDLLRDVARLREGLSGATNAVGPATVVGEALPVGTATPAAPPRPRRWVAALMLLALPLAAGGGALFAWSQQRHAAAPTKAPPEGAKPAPDAGTVEAICLPQQHKKEKTERTLRDAAERYLDPKADTNFAAGFGLCLDLGVFYLDEGRLDDADRLFARLDKLEKVPSYHVLGRLGRAVVLALRDKPEESNQRFVEAFKKMAQLRATAKGPKGRPLAPGKAPLDPSLQQMMATPKWQYWTSKARWHNRKNGHDLPPYLQKQVPLPAEAPAKKGA